MKVLILGMGYVGCTSAACLTSEGHEVVGIDVSQSKVEKLNAGRSPVSEPGIEDLLKTARDEGRLRADVSIGDHVEGCDLAIVCVGTPSAPDGSHNMSYIAEVTRQIATAVARRADGGRLTVAYRSTVRPGTMDELVAPIFRAELGDGYADRLEIVYNPEFLREASAISDYFNPPKIVIGTVDGEPSAPMEALHVNIDAPIFRTRFREAEFTKFVDNSWHAVKVAFANEIGRLCDRQDISARKIHEIFVSDLKLNISPYYLRPGGAFGGSCLPKDVRAIQYISSETGANTHLIDSLIRSNEAHKHFQYETVIDGLARGARILLVGLAFKAKTDDLRESPNIDLARKLLHAGFDLAIYDPELDAAQLVGQNLGYVYSQFPKLKTLLVSRDAVENGRFDRIVIANETGKSLSLPPADIVAINEIA